MMLESMGPQDEWNKYLAENKKTAIVQGALDAGPALSAILAVKDDAEIVRSPFSSTLRRSDGADASCAATHQHRGDDELAPDARLFRPDDKGHREREEDVRPPASVTR